MKKILMFAGAVALALLASPAVAADLYVGSGYEAGFGTTVANGGEVHLGVKSDHFAVESGYHYGSGGVYLERSATVDGYYTVFPGAITPFVTGGLAYSWASGHYPVGAAMARWHGTQWQGRFGAGVEVPLDPGVSLRATVRYQPQDLPQAGDWNANLGFNITL